MTNRPFLLFCLGRTGSTRLALSLNAHPQIRCMMEPFNPTGPYQSRYSSRIGGEVSLRECLEEIHLHHNGIKHVWDPHGWPFEGQPGLNRRLATLPDQKVVFLYRRNILKRILSQRINSQTDPSSLDIAEIQYCVKVEHAAIQKYTNLFEIAGPHGLILCYEDIFPEEDRNASTGLSAVSRVIEFLGFPPPNMLARFRILRHLKSRMNLEETYSRIPNIREVEAAVGSDRTGWRFHHRMPSTIGEIPIGGSPFLLLSVARTGSTSLTQALNAHPQIKCVVEPFNPDNFGGRYVAQGMDEISLSTSVEELYRCYNGIKHVWDPNGWPFSEANLNRCLMAGSYQKLVILCRRNVLKRLVSFHISEQWKIWHVGESGHLADLSAIPIRPLNVERLRQELARERQAFDAYDELRRKKPSATLTVWYEDIFADDGDDGETGLRTVRQIVDFLGFEEPTPEITRKMLSFLTRDRRMNSAASYRRIPNVEEIETLFGSDQTGWLLKNS